MLILSLNCPSSCPFSQSQVGDIWWRKSFQNLRIKTSFEFQIDDTVSPVVLITDSIYHRASQQGNDWDTEPLFPELSAKLPEFLSPSLSLTGAAVQPDFLTKFLPHPSLTIISRELLNSGILFLVSTFLRQPFLLTYIREKEGVKKFWPNNEGGSVIYLTWYKRKEKINPMKLLEVRHFRFYPTFPDHGKGL